MLLITYHLGGPQVHGQVVKQRVGVALGVFLVRRIILDQSALQSQSQWMTKNWSVMK